MMNYIIALLNVKTSEIENMDLQMAVVEQFIVESYGSLTTEEIKKAFKMYVARDLGNSEVYRLFDCATVGEVLSKYIQMKNQALKVYHSKKQLPVANKVSDKEIAETHEAFLKMVYDELVKESYSDSAWLLYDDIKPKLSIRKEVLIRLFRIQTVKLQKKKNTNRFNVSSVVGSVENTCRSIVACNYLKKYLIDFETFKKAIK